MSNFCFLHLIFKYIFMFGMKKESNFIFYFIYG